MSTSFYVYCETCKAELTDRNGCDNHPEVIECIIENFVTYCHLGMLIEQLPVPKNAWLEVDVKVSGNTLDLSAFRKHVSHSLIPADEYGYKVIPECGKCRSRYCEAGRKCCDDCTHTELRTLV